MLRDVHIVLGGTATEVAFFAPIPGEEVIEEEILRQLLSRGELAAAARLPIHERSIRKGGAFCGAIASAAIERDYDRVGVC
jgi:hypothetical protein